MFKKLSAQFWAVNVLNVADFLLTRWALAHGAIEGNPIVRFWGLPAKLVVVLAASLAIERLHSRRLWLVVPALGTVVMYSSVHLLAYTVANA